MVPVRTVSSPPSIKSFSQEADQQQPQDPKPKLTKPSVTDDAFTEKELTGAIDPLSKPWNPEREYHESGIGDLIPGPKAVTFVGRVVNIATLWGRNPKQPKAAGWHYLTLKDNSAAISIKLFFSQTPFPLKLGQLLSVWTMFISDAAKTDALIPSNVGLYANLFPGRVTSDHILIHGPTGTHNVCRTPLEYRQGQPLPGLMTLASYVATGHDGVAGAKILVCIKSIGKRRRVLRKEGGESELVEVWVLDHTAEVRWTVWCELIESVGEWVAGKTILLLSNPRFRTDSVGRGSITTGKETWIDVNPDFPDAEWLRRHCEKRTKRENMCQEFPEGIWDVEAAEYGANVILFALADLDLWVREDPRRVFTGHINVTVMEVSIVKKHYQNMLMCSQCCGIPIYANTHTTKCPTCSSLLTLSINPSIIGPLLDETGCVGAGELLWSERAWQQLLGRSVREFTLMSTEERRWLEQRMVFLRMHLVVGWEESVGKLAVMGMRA